LETLEDLLEKRRELGSGRHWAVFRGGLPLTFKYNEIAWGGSTWRVIPESWGEPARCRMRGRRGFTHLRSLENKACTGVLFLEIDRNYHHPFLSIDRADSVVLGAEVAKVGGVIGIEVPTPAAAALCLASSSANFFFLSLLKPISA